MVKVIINENNSGNNNIPEEVIELIKESNKHHEDKITDLELEISSLIELNKNLENELISMKKYLDDFKKFFSEKLETQMNVKDVKKILTECFDNLSVKSNTDDNIKKTPVSINKDTVKKHTPKKRVTDEDIYVPNKSLRTEWKNLKLREDGSIINDGLKFYKLPITLNELLYIRELDKNQTMTRSIAKKLMKIYDIKVGTFGKLIYNLRDTKNFKKVFDKYQKNLDKVKFKIKGGVLYVNNNNTKIDVNTAREWVQILSNTSHKQEKILSIQRQYSDMNRDMIRIICDSYKNPKLNKLLAVSTDKNNFVENNPSKRKNLIQNTGGIL